MKICWLDRRAGEAVLGAHLFDQLAHQDGAD
jgi:hypothetical protein